MYATLTSPRSFLDEFFRDFDRSTETATFRPAVDVVQVEDGYVLRAELAGVPKESVRVEVKDQVLSIAGERPAPQVAVKGYRHSEIAYGKFERHFQLADAIDRDRVEAKFENGLLDVKLYLKPELGPRQVAIA
jgi:HSP20 family protein